MSKLYLWRSVHNYRDGLLVHVSATIPLWFTENRFVRDNGWSRLIDIDHKLIVCGPSLGRDASNESILAQSWDASRTRGWSSMVNVWSMSINLGQLLLHRSVFSDKGELLAFLFYPLLSLRGNYEGNSVELPSSWFLYTKAHVWNTGHDRFSTCFCLHYKLTMVTRVTFVVPPSGSVDTFFQRNTTRSKMQRSLISLPWAERSSNFIPW